LKEKTMRFSTASFLTLLVILFASPLQAGQVSILGSFSPHVKSFKELRESRVTKQQYDFSCGSAALATLLTYTYGEPISETAVFEAMFKVGDQANIRKVGFSLLICKNI